MAKKAENTLLTFKFLATAGGLWFAWKSYKKKQELADAQLVALQQPAPRTATTPLAIPTGQSLDASGNVTMRAAGDTSIQPAQPTRPLDQLVSVGKQALAEQIKNLNI